MPYSIDKPDELPSNVKSLPAAKKRKWVSTWNSVYQDCVDDDGKDCEGKAYRIANGTIEAKEGSMADDITKTVLFYDLQIAEPGKPFDGVAPGEFTDMWGREVEIREKDFPKYLKNTKAAIAETETEGGELVGLPIDARGHMDDEAAGWITDIFEAEVEKADGKKMKVLRFVANWTEVGRDLIEKGIRRMFSPTLNTRKKIILGGSLTNWPASRDDDGKIMLRPIELSKGNVTIEVAGEAVMLSEGLYTVNLIDPDIPDEVDTEKEVQPIETRKGVDDMADNLEMTQEQLDTLLAEAVEEKAEARAMELVAEIGKPKEETDELKDKEFDLLGMLGLENLEDEAVKRIEDAMAAQYVSLQKQAEEAYIRKLAFITRKRGAVELATRLTSGMEEAPRGLPIQADQLSAAILDLPADQVDFWQDLLQVVVNEGLTEFEELGHAKETEGTLELPEEYAGKLRSGDLEFADLKDPMLGLGDLAQYNLAEFKE